MRRALQRVLDERLDELLADAPRRSVLMIDSGKAASDGGCAHFHKYWSAGFGHANSNLLRTCPPSASCKPDRPALMMQGESNCRHAPAVVPLDALSPVCSWRSIHVHGGDAAGGLNCVCSLSRLPLRRAAANMPWVDVLPQEGANVYSILQRDILVRPMI